jgi:hypothetical protein
MQKSFLCKKTKVYIHQSMADSGVLIVALEGLADAFISINLNRRQVLWKIASLRDNPVGLFRGQP